MVFDGQVWFNFSDDSVWQFYRFVRSLAAAGHTVSLEWTPMPTDGQDTAMLTYLAVDAPHDRGRFLHAMLGLVHLEGLSATADATVVQALDSATIPAPTIDLVSGQLDDLSREAGALGVADVPSLYRHGPVVSISLNGAALTGDIANTALTIMNMLEDDGIWQLKKP